MIEIKNVSKTFGRNTAVDNISFHINEGEHFILLGTSGCGKTTTLKMTNRLIEPSSGTITVNGRDIKDQSPEQLRRGMGYVLQRNSLFPHYTIAENIAVVPKLLKWGKAKTEERSKELLQKLQLPADYLSIYPKELSGGEAQRVNLARALVADPPIMLMDEPFSALDNITRSTIRKEFKELEEFRKKTILMVTHDVQEAFDLADRICLMDRGHVMQIGSPAELLFKPANDFVKNFLSDSYMQLAFMVTRLRDIWQFIDNENDFAGSIRKEVWADETIWAVTEQIKNKNDRHTVLVIKNGAGAETKRASWEGLLKAYGSYKTSH